MPQAEMDGKLQADLPSGFAASSPLSILAMISEAENPAAEFPGTGALPA